jgi:SnoaL-like domain
VTADPRATITAILEIWNGAPVTGLAGLLAQGYRGHVLNVASGDRDSSAYPDQIARYRTTFPGVRFGIVEQIDAGDRIVTRLAATRIDPGDGRTLSANGINISRFEPDGLLAEEWAIWSPWFDEDA